MIAPSYISAIQTRSGGVRILYFGEQEKGGGAKCVGVRGGRRKKAG